MMFVVDTSVWIDHFRNGNEKLVTLLSQSLVLMHPWILGELACGQLPQRPMTLQYLA